MNLLQFREKLNKIQEEANDSINSESIKLTEVIAEIEIWKFALILATLKNDGDI